MIDGMRRLGVGVEVRRGDRAAYPRTHLARERRVESWPELAAALRAQLTGGADPAGDHR